MSDFDILSSLGVAVPRVVVEHKTQVLPTPLTCNICVNDHLVRDKASRASADRNADRAIDNAMVDRQNRERDQARMCRQSAVNKAAEVTLSNIHDAHARRERELHEKETERERERQDLLRSQEQTLREQMRKREEQRAANAELQKTWSDQKARRHHQSQRAGAIDNEDTNTSLTIGSGNASGQADRRSRQRAYAAELEEQIKGTGQKKNKHGGDDVYGDGRTSLAIQSPRVPDAIARKLSAREERSARVAEEISRRAAEDRLREFGLGGSSSSLGTPGRAGDAQGQGAQSARDRRQQYAQELKEQSERQRREASLQRQNEREEDAIRISREREAYLQSLSAQRDRSSREKSQYARELDEQMVTPRKDAIPGKEDMGLLKTFSIQKMEEQQKTVAPRKEMQDVLRHDLDDQVRAKMERLGNERLRDEIEGQPVEVIEVERLYSCNECHRALPPAQFGLKEPSRIYVRSPPKQRRPASAHQ
eukprot:ANDGO_02982.mRNA.1 hypothetical protein